MSLLSQRLGITPLSVPIQSQALSLELRNGLWSLIYDFYWGAFPPLHPQVKTHNTNKTKDAPLNGFMKQFWFLYLKQPTDKIPETYTKAVEVMRTNFFEGLWYVPYDTIEFIANNGPIGIKDNFISAINALLVRENSAYRFVGNTISEITSVEEIKSIEEALNCPIDAVRTHITTALQLLSDKHNPEYRNSIKESISAVESACILIDGSKNATLTTALAKLPQIHPALAKGFSAIYGYTSDADGIRHALQEDQNLSYDDAKFMLVACSAFANYLIVKAPPKTPK
jgi:hypothetical protein